MTENAATWIYDMLLFAVVVSAMVFGTSVGIAVALRWSIGWAALFVQRWRRRRRVVRAAARRWR